ncbi:response regulator transcription factor [Azospirillum sp. SYSU D00513]|uniref:response regulator transcription factor n=1 Tax=Azospirillum sp. SYSU D00513 TaxID=2812561 RepID=UPI001A95C300|nr:response regulator transcription factor [Azospirillum sp. SYSU D00513]
MQLLLADDHGILRDMMKMLFQTKEPSWDVLTASTLEEAQSIAAKHSEIEIIILDLLMPGMNGVEGISKIRDVRPSARVILMTGAEASLKLVSDAFEAGASGFIPKSAGAPSIMAAVSLVVAGERYIPAELLLAASAPSIQSSSAGATKPASASSQAELKLDTKAGALDAQASHQKPVSVAPPPAPVSPQAGTNQRTVIASGKKPTKKSMMVRGNFPGRNDVQLLPRDVEMIDYIMAGYANNFIAKKIDKAEVTVKYHMRQLCEKLGVSNKAEAKTLIEQSEFWRFRQSVTQ